MDFVTSDTHYYHWNIRGTNGFVKKRRHFESIEEMNETLIRHFNRVVTPLDHTYHLGDVAIGVPYAEVHRLLMKLNGRFTFVMGNHDNAKLFKYLKKHNVKLANGLWKYTFEEVGVRIKAYGKTYLLTHFPLSLGSRRRNYRNLCGHIHENEATEPNSLNVGVDSPEIPDRPFGEPVPLRVAFECVEQKWETWLSRQHFAKEKR